MTRMVTEEDFRMPEFRGAKVEDYEFRKDGKIVRKDRWERGIYPGLARKAPSFRAGMDSAEAGPGSMPA